MVGEASPGESISRNSKKEEVEDALYPCYVFFTINW